jgi:hypothetical protein
LTIRPTGGFGSDADSADRAAALPVPLTTVSLMAVVRLPEWNTRPLDARAVGVRASARGVSPNIGMFAIGVPPSAAPERVASHTCTTARAVPAVVRFGRRRAVLAAPRRRDEGAVAARPREHDVARLVAREQRARDARVAASRVDRTMLTLSERWFTTHTSVFVRAATGDRLEADRHLGLQRQRPAPTP